MVRSGFFAFLLLLDGATGLAALAVPNRLAASPVARSSAITCVAAVRAPDVPSDGRGEGQSFKTRNAAARTVLEKLSRLRSTRTNPVDVDGLGRVLRGSDSLNDAALLEVLLGLKAAGSWQMSLALAAMLEAQAPPVEPQGKQRGPRPPKLGDHSDLPGAGDEGLTMADLLGGEDVAPRAPGALQTIHYNVLISSCAKPRRWKDAMDIHGRMQARGVEQTTVTYNTLLHVLEKSGR